MLATLSWTRMDSDPSLHMNSTSNSVHSSEKLWPGERDYLLVENEAPNPEFVLSSWHMRTAC